MSYTLQKKFFNNQNLGITRGDYTQAKRDEVTRHFEELYGPSRAVQVHNTAESAYQSGTSILGAASLVNPSLLPVAAGAGIAYGVYKLGESFKLW
jgi:hypothetical protein